MALATGVLALAVALALLLLRREAPPSQQARPSQPLRLSTGYVVPVPAPRTNGSLRIRGVVLEPGGPAAGVRVTATRPESGQTLSELTCSQVLGQPVPDEDLGHCWVDSARLKLELLQLRQGESFVYAEATTAEDGTFTLEDLPEGDFALWAAGTRGVAMRPEVSAGAESVELLLRDGITLEGRVTGEDGLPLASVRVTALHPGHSRFFDAETDGDGRYRLGPLPFDAYYEVAFVKEGWLPELLGTSKGDHEEVRLYRPRRAEGRVLSNEAPAADVEVRVVDPHEHPLTRTVTRTDAQGRFRFDALRPRRHSLTAAHGGQHAFQAVDLAPSAPPPEVVLELGSASCVKGTVRDPEGAPVAGARVDLRMVSGSFRIEVTTTDAEGRYQLGPVVPGMHALTVAAPRYADVHNHWQQVGPDTGPVDFTLEPVPAVEGMAVDEAGRPVPGLGFELRDPREDARVLQELGPNAEAEAVASGRTDEEGRFLVDTPVPGAFELVVKSRGSVLLERLPVHAPATGLRWVLRRGASVSGVVLDERGAPVHPVTVRVWRADSDGDWEGDASGDARGRFLLSGLRPGRYVVEAEYLSGVVERSGAQTVELGPDEAKEVTVRLEAGWTLSGQVVDEAGQPIAGVRIFPFMPDEAVPEWRRGIDFIASDGPPSLRTGPDGRFALRHFPAPEAEVNAQKDGYRFLPGRSSGGERVRRGFRVRANTGEVRLVMEHLGFIRGRLTGPDGAPLTHFTLNGFEQVNPDGAFSRPIDDPSTQYLQFSAEGMAPVRREVEPRAGLDVDLGEVRMSRSRRVDGQVLDARTSEPVNGADILTVSASVPPGYRPLPSDFVKVRTTRSGHFSLHEEEDRPLALLVLAPGYLPSRQDLGPGDQTGLTVRLIPGESGPAPD